MKNSESSLTNLKKQKNKKTSMSRRKKEKKKIIIKEIKIKIKHTHTHTTTKKKAHILGSSVTRHNKINETRKYSKLVKCLSHYDQIEISRVNNQTTPIKS